MIDQEQQTTAEQTTQTGTETDQSTETASSSSTTDQSQQQVDLASDVEEQVEDTRTDEERAADEAAEAAHAELFGAPEGDAGYEIEGLPEGMEVDKEMLDAATPAFKELGLSNKGASKIAAIYAEQLPKVMERAQNAIVQQVVAQRAEWEGEARQAIKDNGHSLKNAAGETLSFDAKDETHVLKIAAKALDRMAPAGFREWLKETGLSVNPNMVAFAYQAGKTIAEDTDHETSSTTTGRPKSRVEKFYGPTA